MDKDKLKSLGLKAIILFIIYSIVLICSNFIFTNKLNSQELQAVNGIYKEMRKVNSDIRSDFYISKMITLLDKKVVLENLRIDSLYYSVNVSEKAFTMLLENLDNEAVEKYIQRCDINFEDFVGLEASENLFILYRAYFDDFTYSTESLGALEKYMVEILEPEDAIIGEINNSRTIKNLFILSSYIIILLIWSNYKFILDGVGKVNKVKVKEDEK